MGRIFKNIKPQMLVYFCIIAITAIALGLSDSVFANYFKDAYQVDAATRGFIEFPRELPGMLCMFIITALSSLGDVRLSIIAQILSCVGLLALGLFTPVFGVMLIFLFVNSVGMHMFMPLADGIGLSIIDDPKAVGRRMGQYNGIRTAFGMLASIIVFFGFRMGFFSFTTAIKWPFLIAAVLFMFVIALTILLRRKISGNEPRAEKIKLLFRKEYRYYYILAIMNGAQKQIMYVYAPWVLIDLLGKGADTMALLGIIGSFIGIFFMPFIGKCIDRFGVKKMLFVDALSCITLYIAYGVMSGGIYTGAFATIGFAAWVVLTIFVFDKMHMQMAMIRTVYLNTIVVNKDEITRTLSTGMSMDHVVSITCAFLGGLAWNAWGPQYVFYIAAALSLVNLAVAFLVKAEKPA